VILGGFSPEGVNTVFQKNSRGAYTLHRVFTAVDNITPRGQSSHPRVKFAPGDIIFKNVSKASF
jgi:hypothetical protein